MAETASFLNPRFPERLLFDGEIVIIDLKPHWLFFFKALSALVVSLLGVVWAATWDDSNVVESWGSSVLLVVFVLCLLWIATRWIKWRSTFFVLTSERIIHRWGVVVKRSVAIPLERVDNINFHQSLLERIVGAGDLWIESTGQEGQQLFFDVRRPDEVQNLIHAQIDKVAEGSEPSPQQLDIASQLEKLEGLRDRGVLTEDEFTQEKQRLLRYD